MCMCIYHLPCIFWICTMTLQPVINPTHLLYVLFAATLNSVRISYVTCTKTKYIVKLMHSCKQVHHSLLQHSQRWQLVWQFFCKHLYTFQRISQLITFLMMFLKNNISGGVGEPPTYKQTRKVNLKLVLYKDMLSVKNLTLLRTGLLLPPSYFFSCAELACIKYFFIALLCIQRKLTLAQSIQVFWWIILFHYFQYC